MIFGNEEQFNKDKKPEDVKFTKAEDENDVAKPYQTVDEGLTTDTTEFEAIQTDLDDEKPLS